MAYRVTMLQILDMATYLFPFFVDDDVYEGGLVVGENTAQPVDQRFSAYRYERFGVYYPFSGESRSFSGSYDGIFHIVYSWIRWLCKSLNSDYE